MAETSDKQSKVVGEKSSYAIDASGQKGDVRFYLYTVNCCLLIVPPSSSIMLPSSWTAGCLSMQVIYVEDTFNSDEAEGVRLTDDLTVGKQIAGGTQVSVAEKVQFKPSGWTW